MTQQHTNELRETAAELILSLWESQGRDVAGPKIEAICNKWQGTTSLVSNLIRCANDRYFSVTIDPETGDVVITEPESDLDGNMAMLSLLFSNFGYIQRDAYDFLAKELPFVDEDYAEAA